MNLGVMHAVDYWVGIPLCAAVSAFDTVRSAFTSTLAAPPKRLLFIELSEMGSAVLAYPAIKEAVDRLGADNVWFMIFERNREGVSVLDILPDDHIITVSDRSLGEFVRTVLRRRRAVPQGRNRRGRRSRAVLALHGAAHVPLAGPGSAAASPHIRTKGCIAAAF